MTDIAPAVPVTVHPVAVPAALDDPDARIFLEMVRVANAVCLFDAHLREAHVTDFAFFLELGKGT